VHYIGLKEAAQRRERGIKILRERQRERSFRARNIGSMCLKLEERLN
jgi:hypothetical protein